MIYTKEDVAPARNVNGKDVALSDAERDAIAAEWSANEARDSTMSRTAELEKKRAFAMMSLQERVLAEAILDPDAPQPVKDYAAELAKGSP